MEPEVVHYVLVNFEGWCGAEGGFVRGDITSNPRAVTCPACNELRLQSERQTAAPIVLQRLPGMTVGDVLQRKNGKRTAQPSRATMERWAWDGMAKATDGCSVELDGHCPHGASSWLLYLGYL